MSRPTRKSLALLGGAGVLFVVGNNVQSGWLYVLGSGLVAVVLAGWLLPWLSLRRISATRLAPERAIVGDEIEIQVSVQSSSASGFIVATDRFLSDESFVIGHRGFVHTFLKRPERRGVYRSGKLNLVSAFPFGTARVKRSIDVPSSMIVHPQWIPMEGFPLLEAASIPGEALHDRRRRGAGLDFYGIREHRPGDSLRQVHWPSTARLGKLLVREYEEIPASRLGVWIDGAQSFGEEPITTFESAVSVAASLMIYALEAGHPTELFSNAEHGGHLFEPGRVELLDWLAELEEKPGGSWPDFVERLSGEVAPRSTQVVIFPTGKRAAKEIGEVVRALQGLSTRVVAVAISARTYSHKASDVLSDDQEDALASEIGSSRAPVYRVHADRHLEDCLKEPELW